METDAGIEGIGVTFFGWALTPALRQAVDQLSELAVGEDPLRTEAVAGEVVDCCVSPIFNKPCSKLWHKVGLRLKLPDA